jgi:hypothetical protein
MTKNSFVVHGQFRMIGFTGGAEMIPHKPEPK